MLYPENAGAQAIIIASIVDGAISPVLVALRLLARRKSRAGFGVDDYWILFSLLPIYGMLVCGVLCKFWYSETWTLGIFNVVDR